MSTTDKLEWKEVEYAAEQIFDQWGGEHILRWVEEAWGHLKTAELTESGSLLELTQAQLRLIVLAELVGSYRKYALGESSDDVTWYSAEHLDIDQLALGILAGRSSDILNDSDDSTLLAEALDQVVADLKPTVVSCLTSAFGEAHGLHKSLWNAVTGSDDPDTDEAFEPAADQLSAYAHVEQGFPD